LTRAFFVSVAVACFFAAIDVISIYNNAILKSKLNAMLNALGLSFSLAIRFAIVKLGMSAAWLSVPIVLTTLIPYLLRRALHRKSLGYVAPARNERPYVAYTLRAGSALVVSSISIAIYVRVGQYVVGGQLGESALGVYAAGANLATTWSFVLSALITSFFPAIYACSDEASALRQAARLGRLIIAISLPVILGYIIFGKFLIVALYGEKYAAAYYPSVVLASSVMFSSLGTLSYRFMVRTSGYRYLSLKMLVVLVLSIPVTWTFVSRMGMVGAAWAVLVTEISSLTLLNYFYRSGVVAKLHFGIFKGKCFEKAN